MNYVVMENPYAEVVVESPKTGDCTVFPCPRLARYVL